MRRPGSLVRRFSLIAVAAVFLAAGSAQATCGKHGWDCEHPGHAKHIILLIGDGMQLQHEIATSRYLFGDDEELSFHTFPYRVNVSTWDINTYNKYAAKFGKPVYDANAIQPKTGYDPAQGGKRPSPLSSGSFAYFFPEGTSKQYATDSASAATAWATGYKTDDGNIAWLPGDPQGGALKTIAEYLREYKGYAIGVVSTVPFTHATPAAHVSHNKTRNCYWAKPGCEKGIAEEILTEIKPEVVIGGGHPTWSGESYLSKALYDAFRLGSYTSEYVFVERQIGIDGAVAVLAGAQKAAAEGKKLFALFGGPGGNFESPDAFDLPGTPFVSQPTRENPTLKEATLAALKVLGRDKDGFFLIAEQGDIDWANHANDYNRMIGTTWDLHQTVQAVVDFVNQPGDDIDWWNTLLIVTSDHANSYMRLNEAKPLRVGELPAQVGAGSCGYGGPACTYPDGEVSYATTNHTNELVRLYATGAGRYVFRKHEGDWYPGTRILDNTQIFHVMMEAAGVPVPSPLNLSTK